MHTAQEPTEFEAFDSTVCSEMATTANPDCVIRSTKIRGIEIVAVACVVVKS